MKQNKEEEYKQAMLSYRKAYRMMGNSCMDILNNMKRQMLIDFLLMVIWFIVGISWGFILARWWG